MLALNVHALPLPPVMYVPAVTPAPLMTWPTEMMGAGVEVIVRFVVAIVALNDAAVVGVGWGRYDVSLALPGYLASGFTPSVIVAPDGNFNALMST